MRKHGKRKNLSQTERVKINSNAERKKILKLFRLGRKTVTKLNGNVISPKVLQKL